MKCTLIALLALAAYAQAKVLEVPVYDGIAIAEARRQAEEQFLAKHQNRVIAGSEAALGQIPWQAGLLIEYEETPGVGVCGATVVSSTKVITAAHCWFNGRLQASAFDVRLGTIFIFGNTGITIRTTDVVTHPNWFPALVLNNIAVATLPSPVTFSDTIAPVSLPAGSVAAENFVGETATVSGFGFTRASPHGSVSETLQYHNNLKVISNAECESLINPSMLIQHSSICTSGEGIVGACNGDSGGPLTLNRDGSNVLIGLVSFGAPILDGGCEAGLPTVYARITSFVPWIQSQM